MEKDESCAGGPYARPKPFIGRRLGWAVFFNLAELFPALSTVDFFIIQYALRNLFLNSCGIGIDLSKNHIPNCGIIQEKSYRQCKPGTIDIIKSTLKK